MFRLFFGLIAVMLFVGCASKEEESLLKSYSEKQQYHKYLQQTEKTELYDENNLSIGIAIATHMYTPTSEKNDTRDEVFILGVSFENPEDYTIDFDTNSTKYSSNKYVLTLDNNSSKSVQKLSQNDPRLKDISFVTQWGTYYEVHFAHTGSRFALLLSHETNRNATFSFSKVPKFVYTKKGF